MTANQIYILVTVFILAIIAILFVLVGKNTKQKKLTPMAGFAFGLVILGLFAADNRILGYAFITAGIIISIIDAIKKAKH